MVDFVKKNWQFRDIISENELNRIEDGIEEGITKAEQADQKAQQAQRTANQTASDLAAHLNEIVSERVLLQGTDITQLSTLTVSLSQNRKPKLLRIYATALWENGQRSACIGEHSNNTSSALVHYANNITTISASYFVIMGLSPTQRLVAENTSVEAGEIVLTFSHLDGPLPSSNIYIFSIFAYYHD